MEQRPRTAILIVEDEPTLRELLRDALSNNGYRVLSAATGEEAIEILWRHKERVEWLFTNVHLPGAVDGWRVADEFRFAHPLRPVIYAASHSVEEPHPAPDDLVIAKPYRSADVVAALRRLRQTVANGPETLRTKVPAAVIYATEPKRSRCG
jgi:two-component system, OmpR family, response regulator